MKAKKVYEFRTSGEIVSMGNDEYKKLQVSKLLKKWFPEAKLYIKQDELNIEGDLIFEKIKNINYILAFFMLFEKFSKLKVDGDFSLNGLNINKVPNNLVLVNDNLDLDNTQVNKLPDNLIVNGWLGLSNTPITKLPKNLTVKYDLDLEKTNITEIPKDLDISGSLFAPESKIVKLPDDFYIQKYSYLNISKTPISKLPKNLHVGNLVISETNITELPNDLIITDLIYISKDMKNIKNLDKYHYQFVEDL